MYEFSYVKPASLDEAAQLLANHDDAKPLSGGMTLIPTLKQRLAQPSHLIDIAALTELRGIEVTAGQLIIGAATRHIEVATSVTVRTALPALAALASTIGCSVIRTKAGKPV